MLKVGRKLPVESRRDERLTPMAKNSVSAILPKYVAVKGRRSSDIR